MRKILFFLLAGAFFIGDVHSQEAIDSMKIFYRRGYRYVDLSFRDNRAQLQRFLNSVEEALENDRVEKLVIRSYASPDGSEEANAQLAEGRAEELKNYLVNEGNIPASLMSTMPKALPGICCGNRWPPRRWRGATRCCRFSTIPRCGCLTTRGELWAAARRS